MSNKIKNINLNRSASEDFLNYATQVIKERAIPNIEDNLKPVHRRILYTMYRTKLTSDNKAKKSAATVGEVMKIHPHGDTSIYNALVRLSQEWKMRYPLISIQGNKGNINGSPAAAMRYTEAKLSPIGDLMVQEFKENPVPMIETYDNEDVEPIITPSMFPNILCNGNMGIAVGMSSSILPHNLTEVVNALQLMIENEDVTLDEIMEVLPAPDFPTGGIITNAEEMKEVYREGRGSVSVQARYTIEKDRNTSHIVITEVPYLVDIEKIIAKIKELSKDGKIDDVVDIQNNTGRSGTELRIILKRNANINRTLQILLNEGGLRSSIRVGMTVLDNFKPKQTNLIGLMKGYLNNRHKVLTNIYNQRKDKAEKRLHIVNGLIVASEDIDNVVALIRQSENRSAAKIALTNKYKLEEDQIDAILNMRLSSLTRIDSSKLKIEKEELLKSIKEYNLIITEKTKRNDIIANDLIQINKNFGDMRRTTLKNIEEKEIERPETRYTIGLFPNSEISVVETKELQVAGKNRVGKEIFKGVPKQVIQISSKNSLLVFDKEGKVTKIDGSKIREGNYLMYDLDERIKESAVFITEVSEKDMQKEFLITITKGNLVKKTLLTEYNDFVSSIFGVKLREDDEVLYAGLANDDDYIVVLGEDQINKYKVSAIRATGRVTQGVKASGYDKILSATIAENKSKLILIDNNGAAKMFLAEDIDEGNRTIKGQSTSPNNVGIYKIEKDSVVLYGSTGKGYLLNTSEIDIKIPKNSNNKVYNGILKKLGV